MIPDHLDFFYVAFWSEEEVFEEGYPGLARAVILFF